MMLHTAAGLRVKAAELQVRHVYLYLCLICGEAAGARRPAAREADSEVICHLFFLI